MSGLYRMMFAWSEEKSIRPDFETVSDILAGDRHGTIPNHKYSALKVRADGSALNFY